MNFTPSTECSLGVELELQIINPKNGHLVSRAKDLIRSISHSIYASQIKPEVTQSMIEINSATHSDPAKLLTELTDINKFLVTKSHELNIRFAGGGTHPFAMWKRRKIFPTQRFKKIAHRYGYLAKYFTVFGQHIHIGCKNGDDAIYLAQALLRYIPQFITLSASSPFYQGVNTGFVSSRSKVVRAFPTSGYMPFLKSWSEFCTYYEELCALNIIEDIKDIYWDIRPKAEFGTVEIRICDTPLTLKRAVMLAAYAQALSRYLLRERPMQLKPYEDMLYHYNRYQASRYGYEGNFVDPYTKQRIAIEEDILTTLQKIQPHMENPVFFEQVSESVTSRHNDAKWLREAYARLKSLKLLALEQAELWNV